MARQGGGRVLIADDEESICLLYEVELQERGYTVRTERRGERVLEAVEAFRPDVVILDVRMPGADGFELLGRIKERHPGVAVVLNSAMDAVRDAGAAQAAADGCVVKSSDLTELLRTVDRLMA